MTDFNDVPIKQTYLRFSGDLPVALVVTTVDGDTYVSPLPNLSAYARELGGRELMPVLVKSSPAAPKIEVILTNIDVTVSGRALPGYTVNVSFTLSNAEILNKSIVADRWGAWSIITLFTEFVDFIGGTFIVAATQNDGVGGADSDEEVYVTSIGPPAPQPPLSNRPHRPPRTGLTP